MRRRPLGNSGISLTEIGFGASGFWGDSRFPELMAGKVLQAVADAGIRFIDTGRNYSGFHAEPRLGRLLQPIFRQVPRDQWILSSKGGTLTPAGSLSNLWTRERKDFSLANIQAGIEQSIANLQCGYLDLYFLHGFTQADASDELLRGLQNLRANSRVRAIGVNTHTEADMQWLCAHRDVFDVALIDYSPAARHREAIIAQMHQAGLGVIAGTVLAQGHVLPPRRVRSQKDLWYLARASLKPSARRLSEAAGPVREILSAQSEMTPAQAAFAYVLENAAISSAVFGSADVAHVREIAYASGKQLSPELMAAIRRS